MDRDIFWSRRSETETEAREEGGREVFCLKCQPGNAISEEGERRTSSLSTAANRLNLSTLSLGLSIKVHFSFGILRGAVHRRAALPKSSHRGGGSGEHNAVSSSPIA